MEAYRQLDAPGPPRVTRRLSITLPFALWLCSVPYASAQVPANQSPAGADAYYDNGLALAQSGRFDEARAALMAGFCLQPRDGRFAVELGGVAFKQKRYAETARWLRRGLVLNPADAYTLDFLATVYYLRGNLEAALVYWNRIGMPRIANVRVQPGLRVDPVLLDRAFAFAPGSTLTLADLLATQARIRSLGIFPANGIRMDAHDDRTFDVDFTARESNGWGVNKWQALVSTFRGLPYQTVFPEYFNIAGSAINITSTLRWDPRKLRMFASLSGPLRRESMYRYSVGLDLRREDWELRHPSRPAAPVPDTFQLRRNAVHVEASSAGGAGWTWLLGGELSHRGYLDVVQGSGLPLDTMLAGYQFKQIARFNHELLRVPPRRFESQFGISSEFATIRSAPSHTFERLQGSLAVRWMPRMVGDDYAIRYTVRAGKIFGTAPFDELFMLGLERDNDLPMRAHIGTQDGRKGSAPLGRNYFLSNWEIDKDVYRTGLFDVAVSPFLDTGEITGSPWSEGSRKLLWDTGIQLKLRVLGVGFALVYGKDLRAGRNTFYLLAQR